MHHAVWVVMGMIDCLVEYMFHQPSIFRFVLLSREDGWTGEETYTAVLRCLPRFDEAALFACHVLLTISTYLMIPPIRVVLLPRVT